MTDFTGILTAEVLYEDHIRPVTRELYPAKHPLNWVYNSAWLRWLQNSSMYSINQREERENRKYGPYEPVRDPYQIGDDWLQLEGKPGTEGWAWEWSWKWTLYLEGLDARAASWKAR